MSARHSPGPWIAREWRNHSPTTIVREVNGEVVPIADVDPAGSGYSNDPETIANARLIAAAPDLLALAKQYAAECGECDGTGKAERMDQNRLPDDPLVVEPCPDCIGIRAVIAKAEGKS